MEGRLLRGPWEAEDGGRRPPDEERYVFGRVRRGALAGVPAGAWVCADPERDVWPGALVLAERCGRRVLARFPTDPHDERVIGVVVGAFVDLTAS